jgi:hypothetical protein
VTNGTFSNHPDIEDNEGMNTHTDYRTIQEALNVTILNGGGTFDTLTLLDVPEDKRVWAVGSADSFVTVVIELDRPDIPNRWANAYLSVLDSGATYIGTWVDDGKLYVDAVSLIADTGEAVEAGYWRGEKAIYHLADERTLELS